MNAKLCKALRSYARNNYPGAADQVEYILHTATRAVHHNPNTPKGFYRTLKKNVRTLQRKGVTVRVER